MYQTHEEHRNVVVYACGYTCVAKEMLFVRKTAQISLRAKCLVHVVFLAYCPVFLHCRCASYLLAFDQPMLADCYNLIYLHRKERDGSHKVTLKIKVTLGDNNALVTNAAQGCA